MENTSAAKMLVLLACILIAVFDNSAGRDMPQQDGCKFKSRECTYNVVLSDQNGKCHGGGRGPSLPLYESRVMDRQNDYSEKMESMEKSLTHVKDDHEKRLKELENMVRELLGLDKIKLGSAVIEEANRRQNRRERIETELMGKLHDEFTKLRHEITSKTEEILDLQMKLNDTEKMFETSQLDLFATNQQLLNAENKNLLLDRENAILKNQLKDKTYRLEATMKRLKDCENKTLNLEEKNLDLIRSGNLLTEELATCKTILNGTSATLEETQSRYRHLKSRHAKTRKILKIRENELLDCYSAKTQTFCGFEQEEVCGFTQYNDTDHFDWTWVKGKTPSPNTGPTGDHTCDSVKGHFMYLEASAKGKDRKAIMYSPLYRGMHEQCVEFFYHMWGRHVGTLNVYAKARGADLASVWRAYGNQGNVWINARLSIPRDLARAGYQIAFEGITMNGYQGDIAIDDVTVTDGSCPVDAAVKPVVVPINATAIEKASKTFARGIRRKNLRNVN